MSFLYCFPRRVVRLCIKKKDLSHWSFAIFTLSGRFFFQIDSLRINGVTLFNNDIGEILILNIHCDRVDIYLFPE